MLVVLGAWWAGGRWWAGHFSSGGHCSVPSLSRHKVSTGTELQSHKPHATLRPFLNHILYLWKDHSKDFHKLSSLQTQKSETLWVPDLKVCYIYIYAFSRCFFPKWLQAIHFVSVCFLGIEPTTFALLTQCSTTEPQEHVCCSFVLDGWRFWFIRCF